MNLKDIVDEKFGLLQDDYSQSFVVFGKEEQLKVIGWSGRDKDCVKYYVVFCKICSKDEELFGEGFFRIRKSHIVGGRVPCGCSIKPEWSQAQRAVICRRNAENLGYTFLGFVGEWKAQKTKIKMLCEKHGEWSSGTIGSLYSGSGCPGCRIDATKLSNTKPDDVMIASFMSTGNFAEGTKFWRSERKDRKGVRAYWYMLCSICGAVGESYCGDLSVGQKSCACNRQNQINAYINLISDSDDIVALKFGITNKHKVRLKQQNSSSIYSITPYSIHTFPTSKSCKKAERECKQELECGVVLKRDMLDGYTETTWAYNLEKVIEIYERNGGIRVEHSTDYMA